MLDSNYRTWCAQEGIVLDDASSIEVDGKAGDVEGTQTRDSVEDAEWNGIMDADEEDPNEMPGILKELEDEAEKPIQQRARKRKGKIAEIVREKVRKVLEDDTQLAEKRARQCDEGDFLKLLYAFNQEGIHFS